MKNRLTVLLVLLGLSFAKPCLAQTLSNTDNVITLTGTCLNNQLSTGTYTLNLSYVDLDNGPTNIGPVIVSVDVIDSTTAMITLPSPALPTPDSNGYWSFSETNGSIGLTGDTGGGTLYWYQNADESQGFNWSPLGMFSSFAMACGFAGSFISLQ
ncbi:hypothetical protein [Puia dinghuensis]|uniref:Ig-like domain-containing protein n=1 Tax=Puia dinghuensis TaxID=1792502 RepID=A0A8J2UDH2_9BACT|nr:hypothetical protein [Puia dinghuensis]GGB00980.1 hypothetical protein GCM10011511_25370 [Puia dinghuensis]